ncbi:MAG: 50S ribosomal protein L2 [Methanobacteriota archaeon]
MGKRIIAQRRGKAGRHWESPGHRHRGDLEYPAVREPVSGTVVDIIHDPGRSAPLAVVRFPNGKEHNFLAAEGQAVGTVLSVLGSKVQPGNALYLRDIPEGTPIYNLEISPGDGGKLVRTAGSSAILVAKTGGRATIRLPSGQFKEIHDQCRATIGVVAGGGRKDKPLAKAGKAYWKWSSRGKQWPITRSVAKNPVDHPHGGGQKQHIGKPSSVSRNTPPGRKVGHIAPRRTGRR